VPDSVLVFDSGVVGREFPRGDARRG
jgi:hypothetical protein